jgi:hypothetical protein
MEKEDMISKVRLTRKLVVLAMSMVYMQHALAQEEPGQEGWGAWLGRNTIHFGRMLGGAVAGNYLAEKFIGKHREPEQNKRIVGKVLSIALGAGSTYFLEPINSLIYYIGQYPREQPLEGHITQVEDKTFATPSPLVERTPPPIDSGLRNNGGGSGGGGGGGGDDPPHHAVSLPIIDEMNDQLVIHEDQLTANLHSLNRANGQIDSANKRIEEVGRRVNKLEQDIQKNDRKAMRGIAAVAALGNAVFPSAPGKTVVGAGVGSHDGVQGVAVSVSHRPETWSQMSFQGGIGSTSGGKPVMRLGASYEF